MATGKTYNSIDSKEQLILVQTGRGKFGGYKQDLLINSLNEMEIEFYVCTQCKGVMRNACQVGEEQICVCEMCTEWSMMKASPMMKARQKIAELKEYCPLTTRGCQWNGTLSEIETHLDVCGEFLVECEYDCGVILKRCELNNHCSNECLSREVSCEHCRNKTVYRDLKRHYEACLEFPLLCPNSCGANLRSKQTDSHIETDCSNTIVKCCHERFGCKEVVKRCQIEEHNKTNKMEHLEMTTLFAVAKIEQSGETNTKLLKELNRLTDKLEESDRRMEELERKTEIRYATIESLDCRMKEREKVNNKEIEKLTAIIDSLIYPVVLRDRIRQRDYNRISWGLIGYFVRFEISWRFINLILIFGILNREGIPLSITMEFNKVMSPLTKWPFEGRFKLTIIDRVNTNNSPVYESPVVKLQPTPEPGFNLKEQHPSECKLATIPVALFEDRFRTEKKELEFILQIQEAEYVGLYVDQITDLSKKELP